MAPDDSQADVYIESFPVARKRHLCAGCSASITPGANYRRDHIVADGGAWSEAACFACAVALHLWKSWHGAAPSPSWMANFIHEAVHHSYCSRTDKVAMRAERDLLAGIYRRNRAALKENA